MNIVYTSDDHFVPQIAAAIESVMENNKDEEINFYVLSKNISDEHNIFLKKLVDEKNQKVSVIEIPDLKQFFGKEIDTGGWNDIVLSRLFLDKILPGSVHKVLYLDGDTIVRHSLSKLWNRDMGKNIVGAVVEPTTADDRKIALGIKENEYYYNAGVLLIDIDNWKAFDAGAKIVNYFFEHGGKLFANDQDAINAVLRGRILTLPITYNWCNTYVFYPYKAIKKMLHKEKFIDRDKYEKVIMNPCIVHYLGEERPWRIGNRHIFKDDFFHYYSMTGLDEKDVLEDGWQTYFKLFYLFNRMIKPFPMMRLKIINFLIPAFMRYRKKHR